MYRQLRNMYNSMDSRNEWVLLGIGQDVFTTSTVDDNPSQPEFNDWRKVNSQNSVAGKWWKLGYDIVKNCNELLYQSENPNVVWEEKERKKKCRQKSDSSVLLPIVVWHIFLEECL